MIVVRRVLKTINDIEWKLDAELSRLSAAQETCLHKTRMRLIVAAMELVGKKRYRLVRTHNIDSIGEDDTPVWAPQATVRVYIYDDRSHRWGFWIPIRWEGYITEVTGHDTRR